MAERDKVLILYPYVAEPEDAVAAYVRSLGSLLESASLDVRFLPAARPPRGSAGLLGRIRSRVLRDVHSCWYRTRANAHAVFHFRSLRTIIAVDAPPRVRSIGRLARWMSGQKISLVPWVLDLYSLVEVARETDPRLRAKRRKALRAEGRDLKRCNAVVAIGECMAREIQRVSGRSASVIPLWREPSHVAPALPRANFGIPEEALVLLYAGAIRSVHPLDGLLEAMRNFTEDEVVLLIVSQSAEAGKIRSQEQDNVLVFDPVPEECVPALYAMSDVHISILAEWATGTCVPSKTYASLASGKPALFLGSPKSQAALDIATSGGGMIAGTADRTELIAVIEGLRSLRQSGDLQSVGIEGREFMTRERCESVTLTKWLTVLDVRK